MKEYKVEMYYIHPSCKHHRFLYSNKIVHLCLQSFMLNGKAFLAILTVNIWHLHSL